MDKEEKDNFFIIASIPKWKQNPDGQVEYSLQLFSELTNKTWEITRTLNEFDKFNQYLVLTYSDLPSFPDKDYAILNLQKTKVLISMYVSQILKRSEIISNPETDNFFVLSNHLPNMNKTQPFCLGSDDEKEQRFSVICFAKKLNLFFIGYSAKSDMSSLLTSGNTATELMVKRYDIDNRKMETISQVKVSSQIIMINYVNSSDMNFILVGLNNGFIQLYNIIQPNASSTLIDKMSEVKAHTAKLLNFGFDALSGYIYSAAVNDTSITISEANYEKIISRIKISNSPLTAFVYDDDKKIIIIADQNSSFSIFQVQNSVTFTMRQAFHGKASKLIDFSYDPSLCKFFVSTIMCDVLVFHYNTQLNKIEKIAEVLVDKNKRIKVTGVAYRKFKKELIVSLSNGKIQFWSHDSKYPEYVIDCCINHSKGIIYIEQGDMMISKCGESKKKYWLLPEVWPGEQMRKNENSIFEENTAPETKIEKEENLTESNPKEKKASDENDSSYLDGWDVDDENEEAIKHDLTLPMMF